MSRGKLAISDRLKLPIDVVTSTLVVYGGKGMGKTNFGSVLVEEMSAAGLRFAVIDPMGVWWGLRHSANGRGAGIEVLIVGGRHGDLPIEPTSGAVVADLVVDEDANVIIDISRRADGTMWSIGERVRFVTDYCKQLYRRQGERRRPILQVLDEAARFIPQVVRHGEEQVAACMGALAVLVEEGRNVAIGVCLLTQRSARLNKDVAELADVMIAFRTVGPNSRRAVMDWLGEHVAKDRLRVLDNEVRALPRGSALIVSPGWLEYEGVVAIRPRQTFDSSATPKPGQERRVSGAGAKPDLAKYRAKMAETIAKAESEDPKRLRQRIRDLEAAAAKKAPAKTVERVVEKIVKVPAISDRETRRILELGERLAGLIATLAGRLKPAPERWATPPKPTPVALPMHQLPVAPKPAPRAKTIEGALPKGERIVLAAIAQYPEGASREQITVLTGYKKSSRDAYLARLIGRGAATNGALVTATDAGREALGADYEPLPTGDALLTYWRNRLPKGEREILEVVVRVYPNAAGGEWISEITGYKKSSRDAYLARLAARKLIERTRGGITASRLLFD